MVIWRKYLRTDEGRKDRRSTVLYDSVVTQSKLEQINLWWEIRKRVNCFSGKEEGRYKALCLARFDDAD